MDISWTSLILFAQEAGKAAGEAPGEAAARAPGPGVFLVPIVLTLVIFYFLIIVPEKKRNRRKADLIGALKKNDKVLTIGGLYGVVANVRLGDDQIVLKIDEDKDVKIRVAKSSIAQVLGGAEEST